MAWYCHLEDSLSFPFEARVRHPMAASPLRSGERVSVTGPAHDQLCRVSIFVQVQHNQREIVVPLPNSSRFAPARVRDLLSQTGTTGATNITASELLTVAGCVLRLSSPEQYRLDGREGLVRPTFKVNGTPQSLAC
ncbi:calcium-binding protein [Cupriavidus sp. CP313]